jgi:hypothetical protein
MNQRIDLLGCRKYMGAREFAIEFSIEHLSRSRNEQVTLQRSIVFQIDISFTKVDRAQLFVW